MCTVTFIPAPDRYFVTSNRDESPVRRAKGLISIHPQGKHSIHYPIDESSGGSWIAMSDAGRAVCLLNGGFEPFIHNPPYRLSRGLVVTEAAVSADISGFLSDFKLDGIAPFTLLVFERDVFQQLVWDGKEKHISPLSIDQPQIWSSVTLYPAEVRAWRKSLFEKWLKENTIFNRESILQFHQLANTDPENDFIMNRNEKVKTLSLTSIELRPLSASILHLELDKNVREEILVKYE